MYASGNALMLAVLSLMIVTCCAASLQYGVMVRGRCHCCSVFLVSLSVSSSSRSGGSALICVLVALCVCSC
jgi:hypothetical protein